jgi:hypothetical protein
VLAETGDDRSRFADAKGLKAYAGAAPRGAPDLPDCGSFRIFTRKDGSRAREIPEVHS